MAFCSVVSTIRAVTSISETFSLQGKHFLCFPNPIFLCPGPRFTSSTNLHQLDQRSPYPGSWSWTQCPCPCPTSSASPPWPTPPPPHRSAFDETQGCSFACSITIFGKLFSGGKPLYVRIICQMINSASWKKNDLKILLQPVLSTCQRCIHGGSDYAWKKWKLNKTRPEFHSKTRSWRWIYDADVGCFLQNNQSITCR